MVLVKRRKEIRPDGTASPRAGNVEGDVNSSDASLGVYYKNPLFANQQQQEPKHFTSSFSSASSSSNSSPSRPLHVRVATEQETESGSGNGRLDTIPRYFRPDDNTPTEYAELRFTSSTAAPPSAALAASQVSARLKSSTMDSMDVPDFEDANELENLAPVNYATLHFQRGRTTSAASDYATTHSVRSRGSAPGGDEGNSSNSSSSNSNNNNNNSFYSCLQQEADTDGVPLSVGNGSLGFYSSVEKYPSAGSSSSMGGHYGQHKPSMPLYEHLPEDNGGRRESVVDGGSGDRPARKIEFYSSVARQQVYGTLHTSHDNDDADTDGKCRNCLCLKEKC